MKKVTLLLALSAFATAAFAQTTPTTEVKTRDNGTTKVVTKTGKTNVGQALENTKDAAGNVAHKTGSAIKRGAKKTGHAVKHGANKVSAKTKEGTEKMEAKTE
ncbi:hypothetical protein KB206_08070 [Microvirga sp. STS02]|uniref:hypothetical protein n=1 Tax=Hymenobacter negativus TaxID=2795026 RepID=UPI0018DE5197|nr:MULTISPECIES: hypothetical protein [Bacteria]MBH8568834.1 hypothetical protein [Hymenobacter negativus]MBR7208568.1 hypothetical protein [Microvirga sp. STS02]